MKSLTYEEIQAAMLSAAKSEFEFKPSLNTIWVSEGFSCSPFPIRGYIKYTRDFVMNNNIYKMIQE